VFQGFAAFADRILFGYPSAANGVASGFRQRAPASLAPAKRLKFYPGNQPTLAGTILWSRLFFALRYEGFVIPKSGFLPSVGMTTSSLESFAV
jgi:hypothetical protein